jgi:hypothetical protein
METFNMIENLDKLPPLLQFIIILVWFIVPPAYANWRIRLESDAKVRLEKAVADQKERLETLELQHIKAESEAKQAETNSANTQKLIEVIAASNDRFQKVIDTKSERQLEADKLQHETNKMFLAAVERQTGAVVNLTEMLEISAEQFGNLDKTVHGMATKLDTTMQSVETVAQHNRADLTTALGISVSERAAHESTLRIIQQSIHDLRTAVNHTLSQNEQQKSQLITVIDIRFSALERLVIDTIAPRPAIADTPPVLPESTQPLPDTVWNEDSEITDIIPPKKLADDDGNPLLDIA